MGRMGEEGKGRWAWLLYSPRGPQSKNRTEASPRRVKVKLKVKAEEIRETTVTIHTRTNATG